MQTIAHVTHEAVAKVGGIGAVLQGLLTSKSYRSRDMRTILIGPLCVTKEAAEERLGQDGEVLYSSLDNIRPHPIGRTLDQIRHEYHVDIVYGHRHFVDPHSGARVSPEILLIDVSRMHLHKTNELKGQLWDAYGIDSTRYESSWEYDLYVKLAAPAVAILRALGTIGDHDECVVLAHEFMGLPTALAARLDPSGAFKGIFYAHEVSAMRCIVEEHPGHDISFYNAMAKAMEEGRYVNDVLGSQDHYCRHGLVKAAHHCDRLFAVGDPVRKELRFIGPEFADAQIDTVYNGIPFEQISMQERLASRERMNRYAEILLGDSPDYIFSHVTRTIVSKGLWRDIRVLEYLEQHFRKAGKTAVMFLLSTEVPPRDPEEIRHMEHWWDWPVAHREGGTDLSNGEALVYQGIQAFNARSRQIKVVYVNQFGWDSSVCGSRMPEEMNPLDIRRGTDVEFGQSIYEPFGIAQLEPLAFGGICVLSQVCGCVGFLERATGGVAVPNVIVADYEKLGPGLWDEQTLLQFDRDHRDRQERHVAERAAQRLMDVLPQDESQMKTLLERGADLASQLSWEVVASRFVLPGIDAVCDRQLRVRVA